MNDALSLRLSGEHGVHTFDAFGLLTAVHADPSAYGLTNTTDAGGAVPGADLSTYLCWDGLHPTAAGHALIADSMYSLTIASVPEVDPTGLGTTATLIAATFGLIERRRLNGKLCR